MSEVKGVVEHDKYASEKNQWGKYSIKVDGKWYSSEDVAAKVKIGDTVLVTGFKAEKGMGFNSVKVLEASTGPVGNKSAAIKSTFRQPGTSGGYPLAADSYERVLDRRSALIVAKDLLIASGGVPKVLDDKFIVRISHLVDKLESISSGVQVTIDADDTDIPY